MQEETNNKNQIDTEAKQFVKLQLEQLQFWKTLFIWALSLTVGAIAVAPVLSGFASAWLANNWIDARIADSAKYLETASEGRLQQFRQETKLLELRLEETESRLKFATGESEQLAKQIADLKIAVEAAAINKIIAESHVKTTADDVQSIKKRMRAIETLASIQKNYTDFAVQAAASEVFLLGFWSESSANALDASQLGLISGGLNTVDQRDPVGNHAKSQIRTSIQACVWLASANDLVQKLGTEMGSRYRLYDSSITSGHIDRLVSHADVVLRAAEQDATLASTLLSGIDEPTFTLFQPTFSNDGEVTGWRTTSTNIFGAFDFVSKQFPGQIAKKFDELANRMTTLKLGHEQKQLKK